MNEEWLKTFAQYCALAIVYLNVWKGAETINCLNNYRKKCNQVF